ncbi:MAG TPA: hypothetical protein VIL85_01870 [Thermomicrobiales bacterium]
MGDWWTRNASYAAKQAGKGRYFLAEMVPVAGVGLPATGPDRCRDVNRP